MLKLTRYYSNVDKLDRASRLITSKNPATNHDHLNIEPVYSTTTEPSLSLLRRELSLSKTVEMLTRGDGMNFSSHMHVVTPERELEGG